MVGTANPGPPRPGDCVSEAPATPEPQDARAKRGDRRLVGQVSPRDRDQVSVLSPTRPSPSAVRSENSAVGAELVVGAVGQAQRHPGLVHSESLSA